MSTAHTPPHAAPKAPGARQAALLRLRYQLLHGLAVFFLGPEPALRQARAMCFVAACLYVAWLGALGGLALPHGMLPAWLAEALMQQLVISILCFYPLVRSGFTRHWSDQAMMVPQILWASAAVIMAYIWAPPLRSIALQTLCLIQVFGFISLTRGAAHWLGLGTISMLLGTFALRALHPSADFDALAQALPMGTACVVIGLLTWQSGRFAELRQRVARKRTALQTAMDSAKLISLHDALTGLPNRQFLQERIEAELQRTSRTGSRLSVALIDLDHFKQVNDTHGHQVGDEVLVSFGKTARQALRESDLIGRWGGEEFVVLFFDTAPSPLGEAALERIRAVLTRTTVSKQVHSLRVRFSAGLTSARPGETLEQMMARADKALYEAKSSGRNRTCIER
jgi:diguanylate cyclase (GGDEF)-like protein